MNLYNSQKLLIEIPTWLGDTVMATPAIENLIEAINPKETALIGNELSIKIFEHHPKIDKIFIDKSKKSKNNMLK